MLISLGDCAVTGNVSGACAIRFPVSKLLAEHLRGGNRCGQMVPAEGVPPLLKQARPVREFVNVDCTCPDARRPQRRFPVILNELARRPQAQIATA